MLGSAYSERDRLLLDFRVRGCLLHFRCYCWQVRFNVQPTSGQFKKAVGGKTTLRFLNQARSNFVCKVPFLVVPPSPYLTVDWGCFWSCDHHNQLYPNPLPLGAWRLDDHTDPSQTRRIGSLHPGSSRCVFCATMQAATTRDQVKLPEVAKEYKLTQRQGRTKLVPSVNSTALTLHGVVLWHPGNMLLAHQCFSDLYSDAPKLQVAALSRRDPRPALL